MYKTMMVKVQNMPKYELDTYVVARYVDGELWFYGTYSDRLRCKEICSELGNGIILENNIVEDSNT